MIENVTLNGTDPLGEEPPDTITFTANNDVKVELARLTNGNWGVVVWGPWNGYVGRERQYENFHDEFESAFAEFTLAARERNKIDER